MTAVKLALKLRSVTYPSYQNKTHKNDKRRDMLQRMNSFDFSDDAVLIVREESRRREVSAEGRSRTRIFHNTHSVSTETTTSSLSPRHRSLKQSQDTCCSCSESEDFHYDHMNQHSPSVTSPNIKKGGEYRLTLSSNPERLIDWRRKSPERRCIGRSQSYDKMQQKYGLSPERRPTENSYCVRRRRLCVSTSVPPPITKSPAEKYSPRESPAAIADRTLSSEGRKGRLQFRRALSLFSLSCHGKETEGDRREGKSPKKNILRPPTRHVYRRGVSGLPIECSSKYLGLVY